jgi:hypothetical protein
VHRVPSPRRDRALDRFGCIEWRHFCGARDTQLPPLPKWSGGQPDRHLDGDRGAGTARASPEPLGHGARPDDRGPLPADTAALAVRRGPCGSIPQAPRAGGHTGQPCPCIARARAPGRHGCREAMAGGDPRDGVRRSCRRRQPGPAGLRGRDGRPRATARRGNAQHHHGQRRSRGRAGNRGRARRHGRSRRVLPGQRCELRRGRAGPRDSRQPPAASGRPQSTGPGLASATRAGARRYTRRC